MASVCNIQYETQPSTALCISNSTQWNGCKSFKWQLLHVVKNLKRKLSHLMKKENVYFLILKKLFLQRNPHPYFLNEMVLYRSMSNHFHLIPTSYHLFHVHQSLKDVMTTVYQIYEITRQRQRCVQCVLYILELNLLMYFM